MTRALRTAELTLISSPPAGSPAAADPPSDASSNRAPKRMTKRCRRCGKTVPTLAGVVWRARQLAASADSAAADVFRARVETSDPAMRDDILKRAHRTQQEGADEAEKLWSDLRRLQGHERRCHPPADRHS